MASFRDALGFPVGSLGQMGFEPLGALYGQGVRRAHDAVPTHSEVTVLEGSGQRTEHTYHGCSVAEGKSGVWDQTPTAVMASPDTMRNLPV